MKNLLKTPESQEQESQEPETQQPEPIVEEPISTKDIPDVDLSKIENTEEKKKLIFLIQKYQDSTRFGKIVKYELGFKESFLELSEKSEMDLENIVNRIRTHLDNKNLDKFYENMATTTAITYEQTLSMVYPIPGFSDMLLENEDFWNCYERLRIESDFPSVNPIAQMCFMIAQLTLIAHHTAGTGFDDGSEHSMEDPPPLETILEGIEGNEDLVIKDRDDETPTLPAPDIPEISLGQIL